MGVIDRHVSRHLHIPFHQSPRKYLRRDNKSGEVRTQTYSGVSVRWLRIPPGFSPCKTHSERWLSLQDLILHLKSKHVLTSRCLMSLTGFLTSTEKMVLEGCLHMILFQSNLKEHWSFSLVIRHPSLVRDHFRSPGVVAMSRNVMKCADLHPKTTVYKFLHTPKTKVGVLTWSKSLQKRSVVRH